MAKPRKPALFQIMGEIFQSRQLISSLAKNDFKTKFAGSYLGRIWAFVQPVVTVFVYWFVFEKALNAGTQSTKQGISVPYVLWLVAGLVPWFYFSDALASGTNALLTYDYLVKKVVFRISTLPVVKVVSSLFVHIFFVCFMLGMYIAYGLFPGIYALQIIYYSFCMFVFVLAVSYLTCSVAVFFRDLVQIVNIVLQVQIWATPIMWNMDAVSFSPVVMTLLKFNPMYYIVCGYRDALIGHIWFVERPVLTLYFWILTLLLLFFGTHVFRKLQPHFADVL
ncbi:MAG: ABC transporter permease [Bilifractor sp.]